MIEREDFKRAMIAATDPGVTDGAEWLEKRKISWDAAAYVGSIGYRIFEQRLIEGTDPAEAVIATCLDMFRGGWELALEFQGVE